MPPLLQLLRVRDMNLVEDEPSLARVESIEKADQKVRSFVHGCPLRVEEKPRAWGEEGSPLRKAAGSANCQHRTWIQGLQGPTTARFS